MLMSSAVTPAATAAARTTNSTRTDRRFFMRPSPVRVPDRAMASDAGELVAPCVHGQQRMHHVGMAAAAGLLGDLAVQRRDLDGLGELPAGEVVGVPEAVPGLDRVLRDEVVGGVAVVADRHRVV